MRVCANSWATKWCESGPGPLYAESSPREESAFVRVMPLPADWVGRRKVRCTDRVHAQRPTRQRTRVFFEEVFA